MPVWSNQANPPGPLNYRQIEELIAFIRATNERDLHRSATRSSLTPRSTRSPARSRRSRAGSTPNYQPAPGATPFPACWTDEFTSAVRRALGLGGRTRGASACPVRVGGGGAGTVVDDHGLRASQFTTTDADGARPNAAFTIDFDNQDAGIPHNVAIKDATGAEVFKGETFPGVATKDLRRPGPGGRHLHVRLLGALEHDRDPDSPVIDRRPDVGG